MYYEGTITDVAVENIGASVVDNVVYISLLYFLFCIKLILGSFFLLLLEKVVVLGLTIFVEILK
jgi:hypothetical protein